MERAPAMAGLFYPADSGSLRRTVVGVAAAVALGAGRGRLLDYSCSGDVTGDDSDVVAYAGMTIT